MQTNLEKKGIVKRKELIVKNNYNINNEYGSDDAKKGGESVGSLMTHTNTYFDTETGGDAVDQNERKKQTLYTTSGVERYHEGNGYGVEVKVDISENEGQYIVY